MSGTSNLVHILKRFYSSTSLVNYFYDNKYYFRWTVVSVSPVSPVCDWKTHFITFSLQYILTDICFEGITCLMKKIVKRI